MKKMPEKDELVIATVRKIFPYGAFCSLDEYDNREAFIHISEVASRWVKNIHEFLKENQKIVARVYHFLPEKNQIDLSIRRVSESEKKMKLESLKRDKRAQNLLKVVAKRLKKDTANFSSMMIPIMEKQFGGVMEAFEQIAADPELAKKLGAQLEISEAIIEIASQNVKKPRVEVSRNLSISCPQPDGINVIKKVINSFESMASDSASVSVAYLGAPNYKLKISAADYKTAERMVTAIAKKGTEELKKHQGVLTISGGEN